MRSDHQPNTGSLLARRHSHSRVPGSDLTLANPSQPRGAELDRKPSRLPSAVLQRTVVEHNTTRESFPTNLLAGPFGFQPEYYMIEESTSDIAYKDYFYLTERGKSAGAEEIWYVDSADKAHPLSANSDSFLVVAARALRFSESRWFVPDQVARQIQSNLTWELQR